jgi:hypothetical protein
MHKLLSSQVGGSMTHGSVTGIPTPGRRPMACRTSHRTRSATALRFRADQASPQRGPPSAAWFVARRARSSANSLRRRAPRKVTNLRYTDRTLKSGLPILAA